MTKIDLDRGCSIRVHPDGVRVYMYKDTPGVYLNDFGTEVSQELARAAGFDVDTLGKKRILNERLAEAHRLIAEELAIADTNRKVYAERAGFKVTDWGAGRYKVEDPDGNELTPMPLPKASAMALLDGLVPLKETKTSDPIAGRFEPPEQPPVEVKTEAEKVWDEAPSPAPVEPAKPRTGKLAKSGKSKAKASRPAT